jgi:hypothetical protein
MEEYERKVESGEIVLSEEEEAKRQIKKQKEAKKAAKKAKRESDGPEAEAAAAKAEMEKLKM